MLHQLCSLKTKLWVKFSKVLIYANLNPKSDYFLIHFKKTPIRILSLEIKFEY